MSDKVKMIKPSGVEVEINITSLESALALGWMKAQGRKRKPTTKTKD